MTGFNVYYHNKESGRLCRMSTRAMIFEEAEIKAEAFNTRLTSTMRWTPAYIGEH